MPENNEIIVLNNEAIELSAYGIFIAVNDKIQYVNRALLEMSGYDKKELIGEPFLKFIAPEEQENVKKHYYKREKGKKAPWSYESVAVIKSGKQIDIEISIMPVLYKGEKGYKVICHDISERKRSENDLLRSRQEWEAIFQASGQPTMLETTDHTILSVNKATTEITGLGEEELIGKKCFEILHGTTEPPDNCPAKALLISGTSNTVEMEIESLDRIFLISTSPINNAEGKIDKIIHVATDITEQKKAQAEITKHREYYRAVFENTGTASVIIEEDTTISLANRKFETLSGYRKADIEGKKRWTDFVVREDLDRMKKQHELRRKNSAKAKTNYEFRFIDRYKELKYILLSVDIIPGTKKSIASLIDITEHIKADNALIESEKKFRQLYDNSPLPYQSLDLKGHFLDINPAWLRTLGYERDEVIGSYYGDFLHPDWKEHFEKNFSAFKKKGYISNVIFRIGHKDGHYLDISFEGCIGKNEDGSFRQTYCVFKDITEQRKAERELENAMLKAQESDRLKTAFLANMSHEIRTPMNGIMGFTGLLKKPKLTGKERNDFIDLIEKSGMRMLNTINDIVDISRIESGLVQVNNTQTQINKILKEKYDFFSSEAEAKQLNLTYNTGLHDCDANILTDPIKLNGILTNLIKNALKYTDTGSVNFGYKPLWDNRHARDNSSPDHLEFYVKDTGIGVPSERQEAIFNRFEQADIGDKRAFEGSGLGLAISKAYVEMLGGKIQVDSEPGGGSVFSFTIPYKPKFEKQTVSGKKIISQVQQDMLKKINVIVAEDDQTSRFYFETIMSGKFKDVNFTSSGVDTIKALKNNPDTDLILMDIKMPGMDGYEATREIRKFNNDVLIIAQTAYGLSGDRQKSLDAGCDEYLTKPVSKNILFEKIVSCLNQRS